MSKPDLDTLKREALRLTAAAAMPSLQSPEVKSRLRKQQQSAEQFAAQSLVKAGIDLNALRKTWGESGHSVRATPNSLQEPQLKTLASHKAAFQANMERRREALASYGPIPTTVSTRMVYVPEPFFIWASPNSSSSFLQSTSIAPYDSRMKFYVPSTENGATINCDFWFFWFNDSSLQVIVKGVSSQTVCNGRVFAYVSAPFPSFLLNYKGFGFNNNAYMYLYYSGDSSYFIADYLLAENFQLTARFSDKQRELSLQYETLNLSSDTIYTVVPPQSGIFVRVSPQFAWNFFDESGNDEGQAGNTFWADFANDDLDYFVQCPGVALEIQTPVVSRP